MKMINIYIFCILSFIYINLSYESYLIYPFKKSIKESKSYPENLLQNDLEVTIKIGTPPQSIDMNLRSYYYPFFVTNSSVNLPYTLFNSKESSTLNILSKSPSRVQYMEYTTCLKISESIYVNDKELKEVTLMLATGLKYKEAGAIGLRLINSHESSDDLSFIYQIKKLANLDSYTFTLHYKNDNEGDLIIGAYPHVYDSKYNEKDFYYSKAGSNKNGVNWVLNFDIIRFNGKTLNIGSKKSLVNIEFGLIQAPSRYKNYFKNNFYGNKCEERYNKERNVTLIHCPSNFDINSFQSINFILKDIDAEFVLKKEDVFIKENNEYIFGIVFDESPETTTTTWIFGKPFMKKYELVYDLDRKIIGLYKNGNNRSGNNNKSNTVYVILLIVLIIVVISLVAFIVYYLKKPRKSRAFELNDDNFDYVPSE